MNNPATEPAAAEEAGPVAITIEFSEKHPLGIHWLKLSHPPAIGTKLYLHPPAAQPLPAGGVDKPSITLNYSQVVQALECFGGEVDPETEVCIQWFDAAPNCPETGEKMPAGYYLFFTEYPEEGRIYLDDKGEIISTAPVVSVDEPDERHLFDKYCRETCFQKPPKLVYDFGWDSWLARSRLSRGEGREEEARHIYDYAEMLVKLMWSKHFSEHPMPCDMRPGTLGILTLIDNIQATLNQRYHAAQLFLGSGIDAELREKIETASDEWAKYVSEDNAPITLTEHMLLAFDKAMSSSWLSRGDSRDTKDAARYRWLRDRSYGNHETGYHFRTPPCLPNRVLDDAIDAALAHDPRPTSPSLAPIRALVGQ